MSLNSSGHNDPAPNKNKGNNSETGPPNLDELLARFFKKLTAKPALLTPTDQGSADSGYSDSIIVGFVLLAAVLLWILSGIFIVSPAERAVVLRFGQYNSVLGSGLHWIPRFIDTATIVNVQRVGTFSYKSEMLTKDENIVFVSLSVQYRVDDPRAFLFNVASPIDSLQQATASALRQVIGHTALDDILTTGRAQVREEVAAHLNAILAPYHTGLAVMDVTLQPAQPPEQVTAAFDDAINAREDEQRYINQAQTYAEKVIPIAQGQAARVYQAALADKERMILQAQGAIAGYLALLPEYEKSPQVTRKRLYIETMESVLNNANKIVVDSRASNNMMYLPLDKLVSPSSIPTMSTSEKTEIAPEQNLAASASKPEILSPNEMSPSEMFSDRHSYTDQSTYSTSKKEATP